MRGGFLVQAQVYYWEHCYEWHGGQHQKSILLTKRLNLLGIKHGPSPPSPSAGHRPSSSTHQLGVGLGLSVSFRKKGLLQSNTGSWCAGWHPGQIGSCLNNVTSF